MQPKSPRTLTLSPSAGERKKQSAPRDNFTAARFADSLTTILPLPCGRGEGRGEGIFSQRTQTSVCINSQLIILLSIVFSLLTAGFVHADDGAYRQLGYLYLSPLPGAEYSSPQTKFVLVRFQAIAPTAVTNLSQCIQVTGARSGLHPGLTKIATDRRTVIFQMSASFQANELVTVSLNPLTAAGAVQPYQYQFMISGHMPDPGLITARGENPPNETKDKAFDNNVNTKWLDFVAPDGSTNFSWIQLAYSGEETHVVNQYALTSANDAPERDPQDWRIYGVDGTGALTLLDTHTNQTFSSRLQKLTFAFTNTTAFRGYRLEITRVANPATAIAVQLAELGFIEPSGSVLRQYWTGIGGTAVTDLTGNANYPNNPSGSDLLPAFEAPTDWADNYGTRVRGYITAPNTGNFVFWISSDDSSELWLSTNDAPANISRITYVPGGTFSREWNKYGDQRSAPISLIAGHKYYVEARQKEGSGGDNLAVAWAKPGQTTGAPSEVIPGSVLSPWIGGNMSGLAVIATPDSADSSPLLGNDQNPLLPTATVVKARSLVEVTEELGGKTPVGRNGPKPMNLAPASPGKAGLMPNGVSVPSDFPFMNITINSNPHPECMFLDNRNNGGKNYVFIFDNTGSPVWYRKMMPDERGDMKIQRNGMLTMLTATGGYRRFVGLNSHYEETTSYWATNGYVTDVHELQVLADGTYLLVGLRAETVDMSRYITGGNPYTSVTEQVIQQFTSAGELIFQWRSWDHFDVLGMQDLFPITLNAFDFPHINSVDIDTDGHLLISSRSTSEVAKINRDTGEIIWRLGGTHNQFAFVNDPLNGPRNQHAFRSVGTNRYTIFDNGNLHSPPVSRAVEYLLNPSNLTATVVWQYPATPTTNLFSWYMGNAQRLPNGNTLINWAVWNLPKLSEVRPDGTKAFEMNWVDGYEAYRVWRCPWQGNASKPNLIIESYPDKVLLLFNKFGDTNVVYYRIYGGTAPAPATVLATSSITMASLVNLTNRVTYYFRVSAVDKSGAESAASDEQSVLVNLIKPGENMVQNGNFTSGTNAWTLALAGTGAATWKITNAAALMDLTSPGTALANIQLRQTGLKLMLGQQYLLEFDAWAIAPRALEARIMMDVSPSTTYKVVSPSLTPVPQHFSYPFDMTYTTDLNARLAFNLGGSATDVYLDNVSFYAVAPGDFNRDKAVNLYDLSVFATQWLKQASGQTADLDANGKVDFNDFSILGGNWTGGP